MVATQTASHPADGNPPDANPPSFESVWALLQEVAENQKETDRQMKETDRQLKETERILKEESQRQKDDFNNRLGSLTNLFGDVTEAMIAPKICEKFEEFGLYFPKANPNSRINDRVNKISFEVDIMLENGEKAMLIEVKTKLTIERVDKHIERLEEMRKYADLQATNAYF